MVQAQSEANGAEAQRSEAMTGSTHDVHLAAIASLKIKQVCCKQFLIQYCCPCKAVAFDLALYPSIHILFCI